MIHRGSLASASTAFPLLAALVSAEGAPMWRAESGEDPWIEEVEIVCAFAPGSLPVCRISPFPASKGETAIMIRGAALEGDSILVVGLAVENRSPLPLGMFDGSTASGFRILLTAPAVADEGEPRLSNPDGFGWAAFAGAPLMLYDEVVPPGAASTVREWRWTVARGSRELRFSVRVWAGGAEEVVIPSEPPRAWLVPPDSAERFFARENLLIGHPRVSGRYPERLVQVYFAPAATRDEKRAAVDAVLGEVVGGDGLYYYVLLHVRAVEDPVWWAHDRLRPLPQVRDVQPIFFDYTF